MPSGGELLQSRIQMRESRRSGPAAEHAVAARTEADRPFKFPNLPPVEYVPQGFRNNEFGWQVVRVNGTDVTDMLVQTMSGPTIRRRGTSNNV